LIYRRGVGRWIGDVLTVLIVIQLTRELSKRIVIQVLAQRAQIVHDVPNRALLVGQLPQHVVGYPLAAGPGYKYLICKHLVRERPVQISVRELLRIAESHRQLVAVYMIIQVA
jgi:hypothetical protein